METNVFSNRSLKSQQPLGKFQRKILFVMIHIPGEYPLKMSVRYIADKIYGPNQHTPVKRKMIRRALYGLRRRRLTDFQYVPMHTHMVGEWWLTPQGRAQNVGGMVAYWKEEDPSWFNEVVCRLPAEGFFKTLSYEVRV